MTDDRATAEPATAPVTVERDGAVATVRLNRPERRNALTTELKVALRDALEDVGINELTAPDGA